MYRLGILLMLVVIAGCSKKDSDPPQPRAFSFNSHSVDGESDPSFTYEAVSLQPVITFSFSDKVKESSVTSGIVMKENGSTDVPYTFTLEDDNTTVVLSPSARLKGFTHYGISLSNGIVSEADQELSLPLSVSMTTGMDSTDKFPRISDD
ncbi:MAG: hypothetical protein EON97_01340, partial [Chitinophagaceae bacterium]